MQTPASARLPSPASAGLNTTDENTLDWLATGYLPEVSGTARPPSIAQAEYGGIVAAQIQRRMDGAVDPFQ
jgi:hypothetical protein